MPVASLASSLTAVRINTCAKSAKTRHSGANARVILLRANCFQTGSNIAQALPVGQLRKGHGEELLPAAKLLGVPVAAIASPQRRNSRSRRKPINWEKILLPSFIASSWAIRQDAGTHFKSRKAKTSHKLIGLYRLLSQSIAFTGQPRVLPVPDDSGKYHQMRGPTNFQSALSDPLKPSAGAAHGKVVHPAVIKYV
jgi:hypothetical protein